jgi:hypothetical protein
MLVARWLVSTNAAQHAETRHIFYQQFENERGRVDERHSQTQAQLRGINVRLDRVNGAVARHETDIAVLKVRHERD